MQHTYVIVLFPAEWKFVVTTRDKIQPLGGSCISENDFRSSMEAILIKSSEFWPENSNLTLGYSLRLKDVA